jgi:hypothetical protein
MAIQTREYTTPGTFTFTVPQGVTSIIVECIGAGGHGGSAAGRGISNYWAYGGGGAGGSYAKKTISTTPGTNYTVRVANTDGTAVLFPLDRANTGNPSYFSLSSTYLVFAQGGYGGQLAQSNTRRIDWGEPGTGSTALSIGDVLYRGGNGNGFKTNIKSNPCTFPTFSGPGGGGAGSTGNGGDPNGWCRVPPIVSGGLGTAPGGDGGFGVPKGNNGINGDLYGGGGSGGAVRSLVFGSRPGGIGGPGYVKITWEAEDISCRNLYTSAGCCPIAVGCNVYSNPQLTTPASNGYYWDGTQCWIVLNGVIDSIGSCASTTTTTTTIAPGYYYIAVQQDCPSCNSLGSLVVYSPSALTIGRFYSIGDGYSYNIVSSTPGPSYSVDLTGAGSSTSCFNVCVI